jgi:hypothetical protein
VVHLCFPNNKVLEFSAVLQMLDSFFPQCHPTSIKVVPPFNISKILKKKRRQRRRKRRRRRRNKCTQGNLWCLWTCLLFDHGYGILGTCMCPNSSSVFIKHTQVFNISCISI